MKSLFFTCLVSAVCAFSVSAGQKLNFNPAWKFIKADSAEAAQSDFDDSAWESVSVPHTYNDTDTFDDWSPAGHKGEMNQWGGRTWYRKHFQAPEDWKGKKVIIEFEAVRQWADIYLNGQKLGHSENGFLPFGFDLTPHLKIGEDNVLAVMCDNSFVKDEEGKHKWGVFEGGAKLPWNNPHWHPAHGGIYRNVYLHVSDPLHLTLPIYSNLKTVGTYIYASQLSRAQATLVVIPQVSNERAQAVTFAVKTQLIGADGQAVGSISTPCTLQAGESKAISTQISVPTPQLWEPGYPYLYTVRTTLSEGGNGGRDIDTQSVPFGFRWVRFDKNSGFYINDRYLKLHGWGQKSTDEWPGLGAAQPDWMHDFTLRMMREVDGNFVRWGHTAGAPVHIRSADRRGILTLQPGVDGEKDIDGHPWDVRLSAFRDMLIYYRNSPSIIIWEGGNQSVSKEHAEAITALVKKYDPHGGRAYAHRRCNTTVAPYCDITISTEGSGYQKSLPTVEGEYNREESPRRVWDDSSPPDFGYKNAQGTYKLNSEEFAVNQIFQYDKIAPRHHGGGANWIFSDSTSGGRVQSEVARASGEVDGVRLPKEAYHVCKVLFTAAPDLHLIGHWSYPKDTIKTIYVAADCDEVELLLNGKSLARHKAYFGQAEQKKNLHRSLFVFPETAWKPGVLEAIGYVEGKAVARQKLESVGSAVALKITPITGPQGFQASGSDVALFDVEAVDAQGRRCPTYQQRCDFTLSGPAIWRGGYNSGKIKSTNNTWLDLECGVNRIAIRSLLKGGDVTLTATSNNLKPATVQIKALPMEVENGVLKSHPPLPEQEKLTPMPPPSREERSPGPTSELARTISLKSEFFADLSYSGPAGGIQVLPTRLGAKLFTDRETVLKPVPAFLKGGEFIQFPDSDWNYSAVDLLQFDCKRDAKIYIGLDSRLTPMPWLKKDFKITDKKLSYEGQEWFLYQRHLNKGESVLLGSNTEIKSPKRRMMLLFVMPALGK